MSLESRLGLRTIYARLQVEWEENNFLYPLRVLGWIWKLNWERQRNREKHKCCLEFSHVHGSLHKKMKTQKSIQGRKLFIAFGLRKKKFCEEWVDQGWWRINKEDKGEFNKVCLSGSSSLLMRTSSFLLLRGGYLPHGSFLIWFRDKGMGRRSVWPSCFSQIPSA